MPNTTAKSLQTNKQQSSQLCGEFYSSTDPLDAATTKNAFAQQWGDKISDDPLRRATALRIVTRIPTDNVIERFLEFLMQQDEASFNALGGEIFLAVHAEHTAGEISQMDEKYLALIQLLGNYDLDSAADFHTKAETIYQRYE